MKAGLIPDNIVKIKESVGGGGGRGGRSIVRVKVGLRKIVRGLTGAETSVPEDTYHGHNGIGIPFLGLRDQGSRVSVG